MLHKILILPYSNMSHLHCNNTQHSLLYLARTPLLNYAQPTLSHLSQIPVLYHAQPPLLHYTQHSVFRQSSWNSLTDHSHFSTNRTANTTLQYKLLHVLRTLKKHYYY
jgi:hypothetical protein